MSVEPQALERSVLESKDREELATIAGALGLKPAARSSKATLVDQILVGIGVEEPKPKRTRTTRKQADDTGAPMAEEGAPSDAAPVQAERDRNGAASAATSVEGPVVTSDPAPAPAGADPAPPTDTGVAAAEAAAEDPAATGAAEAVATEGRDRGDDRGPRRNNQGGGQNQSGGQGGQGQGGQGQGGQGQGGQGGGQSGQGGGQGGGQGQGGQGGGQSGQGGGQSGQSGGQSGGQGQGGGQNQGRDRNQGGQNRQNQGGQGGQGGQSRGPGGGGQGGVGFDEPGNRRSRRRRGRDRPGGGRERDFQGQEGSDNIPFTGEPVDVEGLLDLRDEGFGFLRTKGFLPHADDVYVSVSQVRRMALRKGDYIKGAMRPATATEKYPALLRVDEVSGLNPEQARSRPRFEDLTPLFPDSKLALEVPGDSANMVARIVDLISPIGKGQRGLIVSPPKAGKTTVLKQIAHSIEKNNPEVYLMVLLVDERPEEVTDMRRSLTRGEVVASTFDRPSDEHTSVAELTIERAKRLVEMGTDVVIVLDGITRLARAYNLAAPATGRIMSGGVDSGALYPPKKFFGAARNIEEGGSLTILATALVETGSRMDEVIFEEFKGTGNMELRLDRRLAERRIYPAIDVNASSTRHEELLFERKQLEMVWRLRRVLNGLAEGGSGAAGLELLMDKIKTTKSNDEFLAEIAKAPSTV